MNDRLMSKHRLKIQLNHRPIVYVFRKKESLQKKKEKVFKEKILQKKKLTKITPLAANMANLMPLPTPPSTMLN